MPRCGSGWCHPRCARCGCVCRAPPPAARCKATRRANRGSFNSRSPCPFLSTFCPSASRRRPRVMLPAVLFGFLIRFIGIPAAAQTGDRYVCIVTGLYCLGSFSKCCSYSCTTSSVICSSFRYPFSLAHFAKLFRCFLYDVAVLLFAYKIYL